jgi:hypothetical protein
VPSTERRALARSVLRNSDGEERTGLRGKEWHRLCVKATRERTLAWATTACKSGGGSWAGPRLASGLVTESKEAGPP